MNSIVQSNLWSDLNNITYIFLKVPKYPDCTSFSFYISMMDNIKKVLNSNKINFACVDEIDESKKYGPNIIFIVDIVNILHIYSNASSDIDKLFYYKYILIVGENYDKNKNAFIGWEAVNRLNFEKDNILWHIFNNSYKLTYQNDRTYEAFRKIINPNKLIFFPIDGYMDEYVIHNSIQMKDIDILFYGHIHYPRREPVFKELSKLKVNFDMQDDIFDLDKLKNIIDRSKIIFHVNSVNDCYQVPYAKLAKLLTNNKIVVVENTKELQTSDLYNYVYTFNIDEIFYLDHAKKIPAYIHLITKILDNYQYFQKEVNEKNPGNLMKHKYNFSSNVVSLIK
jgi:hypothetical protein